jgi:hypothetical protein
MRLTVVPLPFLLMIVTTLEHRHASAGAPAA